MHRILAIALFTIALLGCSAHRVEVQQGNILSQEKLALIKRGMRQQQVRFALGSPLIQDPFHRNRWDYYYRLTREGEQKLTYRVTLHFARGKLARVEKHGAIPKSERAALETITAKEEFFKRR